MGAAQSIDMSQFKKAEAGANFSYSISIHVFLHFAPLSSSPHYDYVLLVR
jgi:hypothetical protein